MNDSQNRLLEIGGLLVVLLLPLCFSPFAAYPFEPVKVALFRSITLGMILVAAVRLLPNHFRHHLSLSVRPIRWIVLSQLWSLNPLALPVIVYIAFYLFATVVSIDSHTSLWGMGDGHGTITMLCVVAFSLLMASALRTWTRLERVITVLIVGSVPVAVYGVVQYLGLDALHWVTANFSPVQSTLGHTVFLGAYLAMVIPFTLSRIIGGTYDKQNRLRSYMLVLILQITCLLLTLARGALLAFLGSCVFYLWLFNFRRPTRTNLIALIILLLAGAGLLIFISRAGVALFPETSNMPSVDSLTTIREGSNRLRVIVWTNSLHLIPERWLLGYGPETFSIAYHLHNLPDPSLELYGLRLTDPHNVFLYHLIDMGIAGLLAFLWVIICFYKITIAAFLYCSDRHKRATIAAILSSATAFLIQAQFNPDSIVSIALFWLILSFGAAVSSKDHVSPSHKFLSNQSSVCDS